MVPTRLLLALGLLASSAASASQRLPQDPEALSRRSDRVVLARVVQQVVERTGDDPRRLRTVTTLRISEGLKGAPASLLEVVQLGGAAGGWTMGVSGETPPAVGAEGVFFLRCRDRARPERCTLVSVPGGHLRWDEARREVVLPAQWKQVGARLTFEQLQKRVRGVTP
jgi:hypothetical protein